MCCYLSSIFLFIVDGHNEAEFGMSWCAGFGGSFYNSYFEVSSLTFVLLPTNLKIFFRSFKLTPIIIVSMCSIIQVMPKQPGFETRRDLYMLYHYLNHYNLFGSGYQSSAVSIIDDYLRMLKCWRLKFFSSLKNSFWSSYIYLSLYVCMPTLY